MFSDVSESSPPPGQPPPDIPADVLDRLRRSVPLLMDAMGALTLGGEAVTHPRVLTALRAGLDASLEGETTVRIGSHWCYITVTDCPLRVLAVVKGDDGGPELVLDDGRRLPLLAESLWDEPARGLRCGVPARASGRALAVRFTNRAQMDLLPWLEIDDDGLGTLVLDEVRYPIPTDASGPT